MCSICRQIPCDPRCPNAPDPPVFAKCDKCGEYIYVGDECINDDMTICRNCLDDMDAIKFLQFTGWDVSLDDILGLLDISIITAKEREE